MFFIQPVASCSSATFRSAFCAVVALFASVSARAQWSGTPRINNPIVANPAIYPREFMTVSDGAGGAISAWTDTRADVDDSNLYAQRLDANGARRWGDNGTPVGDLPGRVQGFTIIADGAGGAFLAWKDERPINGAPTRHLYVQRLDSAGQAQWGANGKLLRENGDLGIGIVVQHLFADGIGGVYIFSGPDQSSANTTRRLHRFTGAGQPVAGWPAEGVDLGVTSVLSPAAMVSDRPANAPGERGVILVLNGFGGGILTRRVNANGTLGFSGTIPNFFGTYNLQAACSDGAGGVFVVTGINADLFIFRVQADGTMAWPETNRTVVDSGGGANNSGSTPISAIPDGAGGVIVTFFGPPQGTTTFRMVAQRISATGQKLWGATGIDVNPPSNNSYAGSAIGDGAGGAIVTWGVASPGQVRAQRLDGSGAKLWPAEGVLVSEPWGLNQIVSDNANGAIFSVLVSIGGGASWSFGAKRATLTGALGAGSRLINLSILTEVAAAGEFFTMGYVVGGSGTSGTKPVLIRAAGPSLAQFNTPNRLGDPKLEFFAGQTKTGENDNWSGTPVLSAAFAAVGAFAYTGGASLDAAAVANIPAGDNTVRVSAASLGTGAVIAEIYDSTPASDYTATTPRLINVSVLKHLGSLLTAGFVISGAAPKAVLVRAVGPTIGVAPFNVPGVVADPQLTLFSGQTSIGQNDNWGGTAALVAAFSQVGAFALPSNSRDAALLATLAPGDYTVQVKGIGTTTGMAIVEVYEVP